MAVYEGLQHGDVWSEWTRPAVITQADVDGFTAVIGDENPIHKGSMTPRAVVPGSLTACLFSRYLAERAPVKVPGYTTVLAKVHSEFSGFIFVSEAVVMRYRMHPPIVSRMGADLNGEFCIRVQGNDGDCIVGSFRLSLIEEALFARLMKLALKRTLAL